jgi:uncharacterized RDD family membrane protein YckC
MDDFQVKTVQNINIRYQAASVGDRIFAFLLDGFFVVVYYLMVLLLLNNLFGEADFPWIYYSIFFLPVLLYDLIFESLMNGQSPGKKILGIRVVKMDGSRPELSNYLIRWILRFVDITLTFGGLALLTILIAGKGQRIGDVAADTTVISENFPNDLGTKFMVDLPKDYIPKYPQVTLLTDSQIHDIRRIRNEALKEGEFEILKKLATKTAMLLEIEQDQKSLQFVDQVINDYSYYTQN